MDVKKIGALIAQLRKEKSMTQRELGARLGVSDRAVSKWERGLNLPDAALFEPLARELGVTIPELLRGEREAATAADLERVVEDTVDLARTQEAGRRRWRRLAGALALLLVLMVAGWLWQVRQQQLFWDEPRVCPDLQFEFWSPDERVVLDPYPGGMRGPFEDDGSVFHVPPVIAWERESELVQTLELGADDPRTLRFQLDFEKSEQELLVLRWPLVRQGEALGLEDGEAVPYDTQDRLRNENGVPRRSFAVEPGYLYSVVISWGDGWFVEYPIRVIEAAA